MSPIATPLLVMTVVATVAMAIAALLAPLARGRASLRHLFWQGALVTSVVGAIAVESPVGPSIAIPILRAATSRAATPSTQTASMRVQSASHRGPTDIVTLLWLVGFLCVVGRYARALSNAAALRRRASSVGSMRWERDLAAARTRIGYHGPLDILISREIDVPVVTGLRHPVILLPAAASEWPERDARLVCLHELAHVERGDHHGRALGALALALHWFNPLMWWLTARADADAELAADEAVLSAGVRSTDYAEMLISVAERTVWRPAVVPGVALVGRPLLSTRVHAILAVSRRRSAIGRRRRRTTLAAAAVLAATMGSVRVRLVAAHEPARSPSLASARTARAPRTTARPVPTPPRRSRVEKDGVVLTLHSHSPRTDVPSEPDETWTARAVAGLTEVLDDPSPQVRAAAARSLSRLDSRASRRALERALADSNAFVQDEARRALAHLASSGGG